MKSYQDLLCDNQVARFFVAVCAEPKPRYEVWLLNVLYDWQTLITGAIAIVGAFLLWKQIKDQRMQYDLRQKRDNLAARIQLPHALSQLNAYWQASFDAWREKTPENRPKQPPFAAIQTVMNAAVTSDALSFKSMQELVVYSQAFEARLDQKPSERAINFFETMIVDIARLTYLTNRLYAFGRMEQDAVPYMQPTRKDLEREIYRDMGMYRLMPDDPLNVCVKEALDMEFGLQTQGHGQPEI